MDTLYLTADKIGIPTGGGAVTYHESEALKTLGLSTTVWGREQLEGSNKPDPWCWDEVARVKLEINEPRQFNLAHVYAGTFSDTVRLLKEKGCKVCYTAAAHDIATSQREHKRLGWDFSYPHLTQREPWSRYVQGYLEADVLVVPSSYSANVMRKYGRAGRVEIIGHGCHVPEFAAPLPKQFTVGYMGSCASPDKGLSFLLGAWKKLNYTDAVLVLAGRDSTHPYISELIKKFGGGNIIQRGWVDNISDFYNSISIYIQPSATEGFGIEVLEAQAHARVALCSVGAGAADTVPQQFRFEACNVDAIATMLQMARTWDLEEFGKVRRVLAENYSWNRIHQQYVNLWRGLLV